MRRCHLRGRDNILKRQLVHVGAFNLSLILRQLLGAGMPRELRNRLGRLVLLVYLLFRGRIKQNRLCRSRTSASVAKCVVESPIRLPRQPCKNPPLAPRTDSTSSRPSRHPKNDCHARALDPLPAFASAGSGTRQYLCTNAIWRRLGICLVMKDDLLPAIKAAVAGKQFVSPGISILEDRP